MITLKIDTTRVQAKLDKAKHEIPKKLSDELNRFGQLAVNEAKQLAPTDESTLIQRISFEPATVQNLTVKVVCAIFYAAFIEFGTRKFGAAYVATLPPVWQKYAATFKGGGGGSFDDFILRLVGWIKRKGIDPKAVYPIALKILREGIKPHPFMYPAITNQFIELKKRLAS